MKILAINTSNQPLSVAVLDNDCLLAQTTLTTHRKHAEFLMLVIEDLVQKADLKPTDLDRVVVADGPGSYTGIRMATTAAKTIASTLGIELVTVSSLLNLALNIQEKDTLINPIFDGRNQNMFTGLYRVKDGEMQNVIADQHTNLTKWLEAVSHYDQQIIILGDTDPFEAPMREALHSRLAVANPYLGIPSATLLGQYGLDKSPVSSIDAVVPRYLRLTKAEADWKKLHPNEDTHDYVEKV
ncbi:tRNA (adenosine(37)-N6)-threonylcarbamoyltransferase complex dimerization subunit type 1 TsaB [Lentilactobacillus parakefiri]|uniref:tRNA threonylcarbamoyladenosine biosynthesis protein TsaB n=1 Tax=Lentilactobacillus parakefiri TaxID=152332 RepID=A0A224VES8_9LACO|nr:tRNA (adenosine(37)-N6)-threonylcarbamoyltransferase complex dimerization subunit type 1 TsaB [Lentilactobacillus parakefiri]KRL58912.1 hypothetical protein FD08_GL003284 [Lentilactobacillus parakefiri DSM 10551]PAL00294.1 tRNA (adenosine(37)-N6)-threonylcarbamoyltransferase complex dimerization subunit type 1 TsaB [Lentilactobacillus parakefiri]TDG90692.1 hypothetical protein C5L28_000407 [Lentilactobacillus parakefiri]GAW70971.1 tRNA threonylcarbamoyladenosine biosynthesis protein TsaB [Le